VTDGKLLVRNLINFAQLHDEYLCQISLKFCTKKRDIATATHAVAVLREGGRTQMSALPPTGPPNEALAQFGMAGIIISWPAIMRGLVIAMVSIVCLFFHSLSVTV